MKLYGFVDIPLDDPKPEPKVKGVKSITSALKQLKKSGLEVLISLFQKTVKWLKGKLPPTAEKVAKIPEGYIIPHSIQK